MTEEQVFLAALDLPDAAARAAYLDKICGEDVEFRRQVDGLLAAHFRTGEFLDVPAAEQVHAGSKDDSTVAVEGNAVSAEKDHEDDSDDLNFLSPSTRPDSLGRLGHYEVLQLLGKGGFGIVFRAFDDNLQRVVAVKVMAPQIATLSPARKRFLREARSSAAVRHENVVQVYEVGEQPLPHLVMEFIPGETLQQRLDRTGPLDVPEVLRIGRQIAEGLAAAHATDLIHRDIKPGNVLIESGPQQRAKITDFGLARAADDASISQSGIIAGTPMFMAPEQALGQKIDQRADLFSLGSVLYQMVSGRPPFRASSALAVLKRVAEESPRPIPEIIPETPAWLCAIIAKLHAKNPDDRFQSAREIADVLADCEAQLKAHAKIKDFSRIPHGKPQRSGRWKWVAAALVLVAVASVGVYALTRPGPNSGGPKTEPLRSTAVTWGDVTDPLGDCRFTEEDGRLTITVPCDRLHDLNPLHGRNLNSPRVLREVAGDFEARVTVLAYPRPTSLGSTGPNPPYVGAGLVVWSDEANFLRLFRANISGPFVQAEWYNGLVLGGQKWIPVPDGPLHLRIRRIGDNLHLASSADGETWTEVMTAAKLRPAARRVGVAVVNAVKQEFTVQFEGFEIKELPAASPATQEPGPVSIVHKFEGHTDAVYSVAVTRDGKYVVTGSLDGTAILWDAASGKKLQTFPVYTGKVPHVQVAVSDDGKIVATVHHGQAKVWDAATATELQTFERPPGNHNLYSVALSGDGEKLLIGSGAFGDGEAVLWNATNGKIIQTFEGHIEVLSVRLSGDGKYVLARSYVPGGSKEETVILWDAASAEKIQTFQLASGWGLALSDDGKLVLSSSGSTATLWDAASGKELQTFRRHAEHIRSVALSSDGKRALTGSYDKTAILWDTANGKPLQTLKGHTGWVMAAALSGDGKYALTGSDDKTAILWEIKAAPPISPLPPTLKNSIGMEFVIVPKGKSWLGGGKHKLGDQVVIPADFYLGKYEVTQEEWEKVMGENHSLFSRTGGDMDAVKDVTDEELKRFPVENVSWNDCRIFVTKLNELEKETGWIYRLPTETEWEYACRGGPMSDKAKSAFDFYFAEPTNILTPDQANFRYEGTPKRPCKVGSYKPNRLGLHDMHGNVWEWCDGLYDPKDKVLGPLRSIRGGSWVDDLGGNGKAAIRHATAPQVRSHFFGFRVARVPSGAPAPEAKTSPFTAEQRQALEWVLSKGGWLLLGPEKLPEEGFPGGIKLSGPNAKLPERPMFVWQARVVAANADEVKNLAHLPPVREFSIGDIGGSRIGDSGLAELARFPALQGITALTLYGSSITDAGLEHLTAFPDLRALSVHDNKITGSGFKYVGQLKKLRHFNAAVNQLKPGSLAALRDLKLTSLRLYYTHGVGDADMDALADMTTLTELNVHGTAVTAAGLKKLGKLTNLFWLEVNVDPDAAALAEAIGQFPNLVMLMIRYNGPTNAADLRALKPLLKLATLELTKSKITDDGLAALRVHPNLTTLYLDKNNLTDAGLLHLAECKKLTQLNLKETQVTEAGVKKLAAALPACKIEWDGGVIEPTASFDPDRRAAEYVLSIGGKVYLNDENGDRAADLPQEAFRLTGVGLAGNKQVNDTGLAHFKDCKNLTKVLDLQSTQVTDAGLKELAGLTKLQHLNLYFVSQVTDAGLKELAGLKDLGELNLAGTQVTDAGLKELAELKNLRILWLSSTGVTGTGLRELADLKSLQTLFIHQSGMTDAGLKGMAELKSLQSLVLRYTAVTDAGLKELAGFKALQTLNLKNTKVTAAGIDELKKALPKCRIEWDGGVIEPK